MDAEVEQIVQEAISSARLSGHDFSPQAVARIRRVASREMTPEEAIAEAVASCLHRQRENVA
ncbi:antitoxin VbhA family protein [Parafrankia sp. FMc2]|uniref:antitoxin VbhA family protein n=1 Tax=Parafrankia sp. FMc2 TaxID=3233196 RepID=UPI0034D71A76